MKKLLKMFAVVATAALLSTAVVSAYATSVLSDYKYATVHGVTYAFVSQLISTDSYMAAYVGVKPTSVAEVPAGHMSAQGRLYNAAGILVDYSSWDVNNEASSLYTNGIIVWKNNLVPGWGRCYSKGLVRFYTGNGYCDPIVCNSTPELTIPKTVSDSISRIEVTKNEYGEIYGSEIFLEQLGIEPDLILAMGSNGEIGYIRAEDLNACDFNTPDEALAYTSNIHEYSVPLYESDGKTIIGVAVSGDSYTSASNFPELFDELAFK